MLELEEKVKEYIDERLFSTTVLFTDLVHEFGRSAEWAKSAMFSYYKSSGDKVKFHCVIVCCFKDGVAVVQDLNKVQEMESEITDCFIYAFNPMEEFIPFTEVHRDDFIIRNSYDIVFREKAAGASPVKKTTTSRTAAATTATPAVAVAAPPPAAIAKPEKKKDMGLRSTALLARMRKEREDKELQRQTELKRRRAETQKRELERDPKKSKQMDELSKMFEDDDDDLMDISEERPVTAPATSVTNNEHNLNESEMEDLLETTTEDALLDAKGDESDEVIQEPPTTDPVNAESKSEPETYIDEDGYTVTKRASPPKEQHVPAKQKSKTAAKPSVRSKTEPTAFKPKKKQGSIESFFKRK